MCCPLCYQSVTRVASAQCFGTVLRATRTGQDFARWPVKLSYLAGAVSTADFRPTDQHREVHQELKAELAEYQRELEGLLQNELPAFNDMLDENQLPRIAIGGES